MRPIRIVSTRAYLCLLKSRKYSKASETHKICCRSLGLALTCSIIDVCSCFWEQQVIAWSDRGDFLISQDNSRVLELGGINFLCKGFITHWAFILAQSQLRFLHMGSYVGMPFPKKKTSGINHVLVAAMKSNVWSRGIVCIESSWSDLWSLFMIVHVFQLQLLWHSLPHQSLW